MAKRIDEVWYAYNAKGQKIPPYKSNYTNKGPKTLIGRIWHTFKENWINITLSMVSVVIVMMVLMYVMYQIL